MALKGFLEAVSHDKIPQMIFDFFLVYLDDSTIHIVLLLTGFLYWINNRQTEGFICI